MKKLITLIATLLTTAAFSFSFAQQNALDYFKAGMAAYSNGEIEQAIVNLTAAIKADPDKNYFYFHRGIANKAIKNTDMAMTDFTKSIELKPSCEAYYSRGVIKYEQGNFSGAKADFISAKQIRDNYEKLNYYIGLVYFKENNFLKSAESLKQFTDGVINNSDAYYYLAASEVRLNKTTDALVHLDLSLKSKNTNWQVYYKYYEIFKAQGQTEKALYNLSMVIELGEHRAELYKERSRLYAVVGDADRSRDDIETAQGMLYATASASK